MFGIPPNSNQDKKSFKNKIGLIIFGVILFFILLEIGLRIGGIVFRGSREVHLTKMQEGDTFRILCLGESTTQGAYPRFLAEILNSRSKGSVTFDVVDKGLAGANSGVILSHIENHLTMYKPHAVIVMMGANDGWDTIRYDNSIKSKMLLFLQDFRVYKLSKLLAEHIMYKIIMSDLLTSKEPAAVLENDIVDRDIAKLSVGERGGIEEIVHQEEARENKETTATAKSETLYEIDFDEYNVMIVSAIMYQGEGNVDRAEQLFREALELNPAGIEAYDGLAWCYAIKGMEKEAEDALKKAVYFDQEGHQSAVKLAKFYIDRGDHAQAEHILSDTIRKNAFYMEPYGVLAWSYIAQNKYDKAEEIAKKAILINPRDEGAYLCLAQCYKDEGYSEKAEAYYLRALQKNPDSMGGNTELALLYTYDRQYDAAQKILKKALSIDPNDDRMYGAMAICYMQQGKTYLAEMFFRKAEETRRRRYIPATHDNYNELNSILQQRGIVLVSVQYPLRSIVQLQKMLDSHDGVIFVDNERIFKKLLMHAPYEEYFYDNFAGDFGHCTDKGNRLIAQNIYDALKKRGIVS